MQKINTKTTLFLAVFLSLFLCSFSSFAKSDYSKFIVIKGNERIDDETIISYLDVDGLKKNSEKALQESLKKLYESDLFIESKISRQGNEIIVEVTENPIVSEVKFIGNKKVEDESLQSEVSLKKRAIFTKSKLQNDLKRINDIYLK